MQDQTVSGASQQSAAKENLSAQRGGSTIWCQAAGALKFSRQIKLQQDAAPGRFGGSGKQKSSIASQTNVATIGPDGVA